MKEKICGIYQIKNINNGKIYIGGSIDIEKRYKYHISNLKGNRHCNRHLQSAWNKHGQECFEFSILEKHEDPNTIFEKEQYYLDNLQPYGENGYNLCKTTNSFTFGYKMKDGTIQRIKNRKYTETHRLNMSLVGNKVGRNDPCYCGSGKKYKKCCAA